MSENPSTPYTETTQRVANVLVNLGHSHAPIVLEQSARTAQEAADTLGLELGQIAKSIIFRRKADEVAVLVVTAGDRKVDEKKVKAIVGALGRADADFVRAKTGFAIGGVSPVAHITESVIVFDASLKRFDTIWAAAGHPKAVFPLAPDDLPKLCPTGQWADVVV